MASEILLAGDTEAEASEELEESVLLLYSQDVILHSFCW